jgi:hypothetical protein
MLGGTCPMLDFYIVGSPTNFTLADTTIGGPQPLVTNNNNMNGCYVTKLFNDISIQAPGYTPTTLLSASGLGVTVVSTFTLAWYLTGAVPTTPTGTNTFTITSATVIGKNSAPQFAAPGLAAVYPVPAYIYFQVPFTAMTVNNSLNSLTACPTLDFYLA